MVKAQEIAGTKRGTEEDEIVATIAVATSSLVTILIIAVIVLCLAVIPDLRLTDRGLFDVNSFSFTGIDADMP